MGMKLPINGFKWIRLGGVGVEEIRNHDVNGDVGYFMEVDTEVPHRIHDLVS